MITINYVAKRRLTGGALVGDPIEIIIPAEVFQPTTTVDESINTALSGQVQVSLNNFIDKWSLKSTYDDSNTQEEYEMFLYSVIGGVPFTMTDYDHSDDVKNVILEGSFSKNPIRRFNAGEFNYSFNVREI